jgi:hypothetical protein
MLVCCGGHLCLSCLKDVRKSNFKDCPLCRKTGYSATKSRFMQSFCSKIELICPVDGCNTAVPYFEFEEHKNRCLEISMRKMTLKNHADIFAQNETLTRELEESKNKIDKQRKQIASLEAKMRCNEDKRLLNEKVLKDQLLEMNQKLLASNGDYKDLKREYEDLKKRAVAKINEQKSIMDFVDKSTAGMKRDYWVCMQDKEKLEEDYEKCKKLLEQKIRENYESKQSAKVSAKVSGGVSGVI